MDVLAVWAKPQGSEISLMVKTQIDEALDQGSIQDAGDKWINVRDV